MVSTSKLIIQKNRPKSMWKFKQKKYYEWILSFIYFYFCWIFIDRYIWNLKFMHILSAVWINVQRINHSTFESNQWTTECMRMNLRRWDCTDKNVSKQWYEQKSIYNESLVCVFAPLNYILMHSFSDFLVCVFGIYIRT